MCRSIKTLRPPYVDQVTPDDVHAAALQYVRKVAGMRAPSAANSEAFEAAVQQVAEATRTLLGDLRLRPPRRAEPASQPDGAAGQPAEPAGQPFEPAGQPFEPA